MSDQASLRQGEEINMKQNLTTLFDQQNTHGILDQTRQNAEAFYFTLCLVQSLIGSTGLQKAEQRYIIALLYVLAQEFGIPVALALENEEFCSFFESCFKTGQMNETANLLGSLVNLFYSESEKDFIPLTSDLYKKLLGQEGPPPEKRVRSGFFELYKNAQEILKIQKKGLETEDAKTLLLFTIKTLIGKSNFENPSFNALESHLLHHSREELLQILSFLENEKEEAKRLKKLKELEALLPKEEQLENRINFFQGENLPFSESEQNEYKDYAFPFSEALEKTLSKTVCSFLNQKGGRIFIGITDNKVVKGILLNQSQKQEFIALMNRLLSTFEPSIIGQDLVKIFFLPIYDKTNNQIIPNLHVVKVVVLQGDPHDIYSVSKDVLQCYVRYEDQSKLLSAVQTKEAIIERYAQATSKTNNNSQLKTNQTSYLARDDSAIDPNPFQLASILENPHFETRSRNESVTSAYDMTPFDMNISVGSKCDLDQTIADMNNRQRDSLKGRTSTYEETTIDSTYTQVFSDAQGRSFVPFLEDTSFKDRSCDSKILEDLNSNSFNFNCSKPGRKSLPRNTKEKANNKSEILKNKELFSEEFPKVKAEAYSFSSALFKDERKSVDSSKKKIPAKNEPKQYYSHILETVNSLQINGTNAMKVNEIFIDGLPTTWTQEAFEKFVEDLNCKSVLSSRMFKKDTGHCNGKAFVNFTDKEEARLFVEKYDQSTTYGKPLKVKFK